MNFRITNKPKGSIVEQKINGSWIAVIVDESKNPYLYSSFYEARERLISKIDESLIKNRVNT